MVGVGTCRTTGIEGQSPVFKEAQEAGGGGRRARGPSEAEPFSGHRDFPRTHAQLSLFQKSPRPLPRALNTALMGG